MELLALGVSHKTAPVAVRERLAFSDTEARRFLDELVREDDGLDLNHSRIAVDVSSFSWYSATNALLPGTAGHRLRY